MPISALLELCAVHQVEWVWLPTEGVDEYDRCHRLAHQVLQQRVRQVAESRGEAGAVPDRVAR